MFTEKAYFITAIGTNVGKTIVSAVLAEALQADYWKPVQCGNLDDSDSMFISSHTKSMVHPEKFRLQMAASPHIASAAENKEINLVDFVLPVSAKKILVEGAGGIMVPLNNHGELVIDIAEKFSLPLIIVSSCYLGSINHTLLSIHYANSRRMKIEAVIFTGETVVSSVDAVKNHFPGLNYLAIPEIDPLHSGSISMAARKFKETYLK